MTEIVSGVRAGPFVLFKDTEGRRHAVRHGTVLAISESDDDLTLLQMSGSRSASVRQAFDTVMAWFQ